MKLHHVRPLKPGEQLQREDQLAWKIACVAADRTDSNPDAAEMAAMRIIDSWAVAIAALDRPSVRGSQGAALAHQAERGASIIGFGGRRRAEAYWAGYANAAAIRELDFNDSFFSADSSHPSDVIGPVASVAEQCGLSGATLLKGIAVAYEIQISLVKGIALNRHRIDHVAHLGPAVAAGIGAMLNLSPETNFHAVSLAAHLSVSTRQTRKGDISSYKASAPGHVGQLAIFAVDRAMRGETSPAPVYEGDYGLLAILLDGPGSEAQVPLPEKGEPPSAILESYPKEHSAGYHGQALIDLACRMRGRIGSFDKIRDIAIHTKELTHLVMGVGSGDREKYDPDASRETLDHSAMFIFAVALQDGGWHHTDSYLRERVTRPDTVSLWQKVRTVSDRHWTREFLDPAPLDKAHGARVVITFEDGSTIEDELRVANAHPRGAAPWVMDDYRGKFHRLAEGLVALDEIERFLETVSRLPGPGLAGPVDLRVEAGVAASSRAGPGIFDLGKI